ncbi:MAG TPA: NAD-dependent epimerase/dehydratase family protein [Anaerolineae bacterium]|nr:NAD-dependent epimerase/dehydratase family protein [Anaerolineae bacterium]
MVPAFDPKTSHIGLHRVSAIIREYVHKDAYLIRTKYGKTIRVTGDHSLFKRDANGLPVATPARELRVGDYIATLGILPAMEVFSDELHIGEKLQQRPEVGYDFLVVSDETGDLLLSRAEDIRELIYDEEHYQGYRGPRSSVYFWTTRQWCDYDAVPLAIYNRLGIKLPPDAKLRPRFSPISIPIKVKLDEDMLWLCGFFLAEGHPHYDEEHRDYYLRFDSEEALLRKASKIVETHFGLNPSYSPPTAGRSPSIIVRSKPLTYLFTEVLGLGGLSGERRVPDWVFTLPLEKLKHFIKGYYEGDALHHGKSRVKRRLFYAATSSCQLAEDLVLLLLRFGIIASLQGPYRNSARRGGEKKYVHYKVIAYGLDSLDPLNWSANECQNLQTYKTNEITWARVKEIKRLEYKGYVYDFSVPGVENFVANLGIIMHNTFGPFQYPEKIIPLFITNAIDDLPLPLYGDGLNVRDWIYVLDHCEAINVVLHKGTPGEIYNIGTGNELPNIELTKLILRLLGKPESLIQHVADRPGHDRRYSLDCSKLQALGWRSRHTFEEALEKTVRWYLENEWWWRKIKSGEYWEYYRRQYGDRPILSLA